MSIRELTDEEMKMVCFGIAEPMNHDSTSLTPIPGLGRQGSDQIGGWDDGLGGGMGGGPWNGGGSRWDHSGHPPDPNPDHDDTEERLRELEEWREREEQRQREEELQRACDQNRAAALPLAMGAFGAAGAAITKGPAGALAGGALGYALVQTAHERCSRIAGGGGDGEEETS